MPIYINKDVIVVKNNIENVIFTYDRKERTKCLINEDMFDILNYIYQNEGISSNEINIKFGNINDIIESLFTLNIITQKKQERYHNIKELCELDTARVFVELTNKCNLRCKHCYGNFKIENNNELNIDALDKIINQAVDLNVYQFDLTGGEPLLYSNLDLLLKKLYEAGMLITIFSNLTLLNKHQIDLFEKYRVKKIITSIDSNYNNVHDEFRGMNGALNRTLNNINQLKKTNIELSINTMVGKHNEDNICDTISFLKELDLPCLLDSIIPSGRAYELDEDAFKSAQIIHDFYNNKDLNVQLKITDCGIGKRFVYIKSNGNICLCPNLTTDEFIFGNINDRNLNLLSIWKNMTNRYGNLKCTQECSKKSICNGGCRARALMFQKSLYGKDINSCILCGECKYNEIK